MSNPTKIKKKKHSNKILKNNKIKNSEDKYYFPSFFV